jgi:hypothetical protein
LPFLQQTCTQWHEQSVCVGQSLLHDDLCVCHTGISNRCLHWKVWRRKRTFFCSCPFFNGANYCLFCAHVAYECHEEYLKCWLKLIGLKLQQT